MKEPENDQWYTRPVFFVEDVGNSIKFYCNILGFEKVSDYKEGNRLIVAQVNRGDKCELLLTEDVEKAGNSRIYIELWPGELSRLKKELREKNIPSRNSRWGAPIIEIKDPDGNEIYFPLDENGNKTE